MQKPPVYRKNRFDFKTVRRPLFFALAFVYLGFHVLHGERGLYALFKESHQQTILEREYERARAEREFLELKVSHLRDESLDLDLLDEQYRRMLGGAKEGEVLILLNQE